jgi:hypothetical protein
MYSDILVILWHLGYLAAAWQVAVGRLLLLQQLVVREGWGTPGLQQRRWQLCR